MQKMQKMQKMQNIVLLFIAFLLQTLAIQYRIINTAVVNKVPNVKLHHIIVLSNSRKNIYILDFTPLNVRNNLTKIKLLFGFTIPADIRLCNIKNVDYNDDTQIMEKWKDVTLLDDIELQNNNQKIYKSIRDKQMKIIIKNAFQFWNKDMNMYNNNCQHFSHFVIHDIRQQNIE